MNTGSGRHFRRALLLLLLLMSHASCNGVPLLPGGLQEQIEAIGREVDTVPSDAGPTVWRYAEFQLEIERLGVFHAPGGVEIGYYAEGEAELRAIILPLWPPDPANLPHELTASVFGSGTGTAGYNATRDPCVNQADWPITYNVLGTLEFDSCRLDLNVQEIWPQMAAFASCPGGSASAVAPLYMLPFNNLLFTTDNSRLDTETNLDMTTWLNTFTLTSTGGEEHSDCHFLPPPR